MRILLSAYACEPGKGSEPEAGLQMALIAASEHEVWLITRKNNLPSLRSYLEDHPLRNRIHLVGLDVQGWARRLKKRGGLLTLHWYYDRWQRQVGEVATKLDRDLHFDVVHHATFASYWTRVGVAALDKPLVWGPIGGGVVPPILLVPTMGLASVAEALVRLVWRPSASGILRAKSLAQQASVVLVQNTDTASRLGLSKGVAVLPNALLAARSLPRPSGRRTSSRNETRIVVASRLVGWKGVHLAIRALKHVQDTSAILEIYGNGPQRCRLEALASDLGLGQRIVFHGRTERTALLTAISRSSVLVHPALHEEAGFVVAEALSYGTPVVCLDRGGPPIIAGFWPDVPNRVVCPTTASNTAEMIANAVDELMGKAGPPTTEPASYFSNQLLNAYRAAASASS